MHNGPADDRTRARLLLIIGAGMLVRLIVAAAFWGSRDITLQIHHADLILDGKSAWTSKLPLAYFLPPLMQKLAAATGLAFEFAQKLPAIAGDLLAALLLIRIARRWRPEKTLIWPAVYLLNPLTVILSAYHGNVDPLMAATMLWALELRWRDRPISAGAALGAAITMKPTALLALPVLLFPLARRGNVRTAAAAVLTAVLICAPFMIADPSFGRFLLNYSGPFGTWGIPLMTRGIEGVLRRATPAQTVLLGAVAAFNAFLAAAGKYVLAVATALWFAIVARRRDTSTFVDAAVVMAGTYLVFYVFTPGFGVQYFSLAFPFLLVASVRLAVAYSAVIPPFLITTYLQSRMPDKYGVLPISEHLGLLSRADLAVVIANGILAVAAWSTCAWILWRHLGRAASARPSSAAC